MAHDQTTFDKGYVFPPNMRQAVEAGVLMLGQELSRTHQEAQGADGLQTQINVYEDRRIDLAKNYVVVFVSLVGLYFARLFFSSDYTATMLQTWLPLAGIVGGILLIRVERWFIEKIHALALDGQAYEKRERIETRRFSHLDIPHAFWATTPLQQYVAIGSFIWATIAFAHMMK
jgi:hypothetical protein